MSLPALDVQAVSHSYGDRPALRGVSLQVQPGTLLGILGPNGGGKTTLFRVISTLLQPTSGQAHVFGFDTSREPSAVRRRIGMVFQTPALDEELTVRENAMTSAALYGLSGEGLKGRFASLAAAFDLSERTSDRVRTLSGGLKRRADLLRGLLHKPDLLLLDEPTTGLDPAARRTFWEILARLKRAEGTTMLAATHLMEEAEICDEVAIIDAGCIIARGTPSALRSQLGEEALWLESEQPSELEHRIRSHFGFETRIVGSYVQVTSDNVISLVAPLHESLGQLIDAATVRRPTLEDVFLHLTGHVIDGVHQQPEADRATPVLSESRR